MNVQTHVPSSVKPMLQLTAQSGVQSSVFQIACPRATALAIFDPQVPDWEVLRAGLLPGVASVVLDPGRDGIEQLTEVLTARRWETVSVFGHGAPGRMQLGAGALDGESLSEAAPEVATWQVEALRLYGCQVGAGAAGRDLVARLHRLTGAAVAAATGVLGAAGWQLDVGEVGSVLPIAPAVAASYRGTLIVVDRADDVTDGADGKTTLREAIAAASAGDTITFDSSVFSAETTEIALGHQLTLNKNVTVKGDVDGDGDGDVTLKGQTVIINWGVTANLSGLTITGSNSSGMYNAGNAILTNVIFSGNSTSSSGGGMAIAAGAIATLTNVIFSGNSAGSDDGGVGGGGMFNGGTATLTNVIFSENSTSGVGTGGGMYNGGTATLTNAIFWGNTASTKPQISGGTVTISKSIVQGGYSGGTGILDVDPQFVDAANGDFRLQAGSPAIDAGDSSAVTGVTTDLGGNPRIQGAAVDLGAYEFTASSSSGNTSSATANNTPPPEPLANFAQPGGGGVPDGQIDPVSFTPGGESQRRIFQIFNGGNADLELLDVALPPGFSLVGLSRRTIPGGQAALLEVAFTGDTPGLHTGNLIVKTNIPGQPFYNFPLEALVADTSGTLPTRDSATDTDDEILGGSGSQVLSGLGGNDALNGNQGDDVLDGGDGDDILNGGQGEDVLIGGAGNDILAGDLGSDALIGGDGADTFVLGETKGIDTIYDFTAGSDRIALEPTLTFADLTLTPLDGNLQLFAGAKQLAIVLNTTTLTAADFGTL